MTMKQYKFNVTAKRDLEVVKSVLKNRGIKHSVRKGENGWCCICICTLAKMKDAHAAMKRGAAKKRPAKKKKKNPNGAKRCAIKAGKLTTRKRKKLRSSVFGLPKSRRYPMPDAAHAANAKGRAKAALKKGQLTQAQYNQIVRKANQILRSCGIKPERGFAKGKKVAANAPRKSPKRNTSKKKVTHQREQPDSQNTNPVVVYNNPVVVYNGEQRNRNNPFPISKALVLGGVLMSNPLTGEELNRVKRYSSQVARGTERRAVRVKRLEEAKRVLARVGGRHARQAMQHIEILLEGSGRTRSRSRRRNMPVETAWDRATGSQKIAMLQFLGLDRESARSFRRDQWHDLDPIMRSKLQKYWHEDNPRHRTRTNWRDRVSGRTHRAATNPIEYIVWGIPPGTVMDPKMPPAFYEKVLYTKSTSYEHALKVCEALKREHGVKNCRVQTLDPGKPPDFSKIFNKNPRGKRRRKKNPLLQTVLLSGANPPRKKRKVAKRKTAKRRIVKRKATKRKVVKRRSNPGHTVKPPFRNGQKVSVEKARAWIVKSGNRELLKQFDQAYKLQVKANRKPAYVVWKNLAVGSPKKIDAMTALVQYGTTDETLYKAVPGSKKGSHLYVHKWGDGTGKKKPVPLLTDSTGKFLMMPLGKGQTARDWMRG
jgi:hypothetical protein